MNKYTHNPKTTQLPACRSFTSPCIYTLATQNGHTLTIAGVENYPIEINKGVKIDRRDIPSEHEEADPIIAQRAILACIQGGSCVDSIGGY